MGDFFFGIYVGLYWMVKQVSTYFSQRESTGFEILVGFETAAESPGECRRAQERRVGQKRGTSHPDFRATRGPRIWVDLSMGMNQTQQGIKKIGQDIWPVNKNGKKVLSRWNGVSNSWTNPI